MSTEAITNTDTFFKEHDAISIKISRLNISKGLKTVFGGAWTYDKLAKNCAVKLGISNAEAWKLGVDKLIELVD